MNLVEHYIEEVISVNALKPETFIPKEPLYNVKMIVNCYGNIEEVTRTFFKSEWEQAQKVGYYLA